MARWVGVLRAALLSVGLAVPASAAAALSVGDRAPEFAVSGTDGKSYSLAQLKGRWVVLAWFPKAFTGG